MTSATFAHFCVHLRASSKKQGDFSRFPPATFAATNFSERENVTSKILSRYASHWRFSPTSHPVPAATLRVSIFGHLRKNEAISHTSHRPPSKPPTLASASPSRPTILPKLLRDSLGTSNRQFNRIVRFPISQKRFDWLLSNSCLENGDLQSMDST